MNINRFALNPSDTLWISVSIERSSPCNLHAGIIYRDAKNNLRRLHFAFHEMLRDENCKNDIPCARLEVDPADEQFLAGFCGKIARSSMNKSIPYNLKYDQDVEFNPQTGAVVFGAESTGLGCATFVVAVFRSSGNSLIDSANWPKANAEDISVRKQLIKMLKNGTPSARAQAVKIKRELTSPRIRPEHVAGACLEEEYPVQHAPCDENGKWLVKQLPAYNR